jgi:8-amino-7-oxononanoate synthase
MKKSSLADRCVPFADYITIAKSQGIYPYFQPVARSWGTEVEVNGKRMIMIGSNDYLGLSHDRRVQEAAEKAIRRWGTGPGGSRFLSGNTTLLEELEERLADFVGKKKAVVHVTGFSANLGALACLLTPQDVLLGDRENHASILQGWQASRSRLVTFTHNSASAASRKLAELAKKPCSGVKMLVTEGVFSMSGDFVTLPEFIRLKKHYPDLLFYLDDAHGLGVMGHGGRGTANHFGLTDQIDFIMGTFSKALASIGGFIASDNEVVMEFLRHHSKTLIFSAALAASNTAAVLAVLDIIAQEPERIDRLKAISRRVYNGYKEIGLRVNHQPTHIMPIHIGDEMKAAFFSKDLFDHGIFALPALYPAVPRGQALIRTAYMSTHKDRQIDYIFEVVERLAKKYEIQTFDQEAEAAILPKGHVAQLQLS